MSKYDVTANISMQSFDGKVPVVVEFDKNNENYGELKYKHIMTHSECEFVSQVLQGWSEQDTEENQKWAELINRIEKNDNLIEYMAIDKPYHYEFIIDANGWLTEI